MNRILSSITLALAALCFNIPTIRADDTPAVKTTDDTTAISTSITPAFASSYMFRGSLLGKESFQPTVSSTYGGLNLLVWVNTPVSAKEKLTGQPTVEYDPQGSYTFALTDSLSIQPGFTWYNYSAAVDGDGLYRSTFEPNLAVSYTVADITLTPKAYYDVVLRGPTYELSAAHSIPWKAFGTEFDLLGTIGTYDQADVVKGSKKDTKAWGDYWLLGVTCPFEITKGSQLSIGWAYTKGWDSYSKEGTAPKVINTSAVGRGVVTVSYNLTF